MSKKITHEQAREGLLQVYIYNDIHTNEANYVLVRDYITQQGKQEELLELYRKFLENILSTSILKHDRARVLIHKIKWLEENYFKECDK